MAELADAEDLKSSGVSSRSKKMNRLLEKYKRMAPVIASEAGVTKNEVARVLSAMESQMSQCRRQKNPPPPPGSISMSAASRKYNMWLSTIQGWVDKGLIPVVLRTKRYKYINEITLQAVIKKYQTNPGQGKQTLRIRNIIEDKELK